MSTTATISREEIVRQVESLPNESLEPLARFIKLLRGEVRLGDFDNWAFSLPDKYGFSHLTEEDVAGIVHETRAEQS